MRENKLKMYSMRLTPNIQKAINTSAVLHREQKRKAGDYPYVVHLFSVAWILQNYTDNEDVIVASLLHDVLEDVPDYREQDMRQEFGDTVTDLVKWVSEDKDPNEEYDKRATWETRKKDYLEKLSHAPEEALLITVADKIHNLRSMMDAYEGLGDKLWEKFNNQKGNKMGFYERVYDIVEKRTNNEIVALFREVLEEAKKVF